MKRSVDLPIMIALWAFSAVAPASHAASYTTLASFNSDNGANPYAGLLADAGGNFYGTTLGGGSSNYGTVFRLDAGTNTLSALASFNYGNGAYPSGEIVADATGNVYGTTYQGGASTLGVVFRLDAGANTTTTLASFNATNGAVPYGGLIADAAGNLYGATYQGTIYRIAAGTNSLTTLATFNGANGSAPRARLLSDALGNLYGTAEYGGASNRGTIFRVEAGTNTLTALASFDGANGAFPVGGLIADDVGNLFGTTESGGEHNYGTVFRLNASTNSLTTLVCLATRITDLGFPPAD